MRVFVTGAGGFLGGWVVESFSLAGVPVRAGIRNWNTAVRLARRNSDVVRCDILSPDDVTSAIEGCDAIVHCAVGNEEVCVEGTKNVLEAARRARVRRVVHLSSVAVYGKVPGTLAETAPRQARGNPYAHYKIRAEEVCEQYVQQGQPVVILRPSIIYGPFSDTWTVSFAARLMSGSWGTLGSHGEGTCNLVYVTDVVQAIYRALVTPGIEGRTYNVNGAELPTWNEFFSRYYAALGCGELGPKSVTPMLLKAKLLSPVRNVARFALNRFGSKISRLHARSSLAARYMNSTESSLKLTPTPEQLKLYRVRAEYVIDQARQDLGYTPLVGVDEGLRQSVAWLKAYGVVY
ncbi:MAG: NAD-dependent epimerase/dehydratase family protein [Planctomycetales bacterium]|nr:NAD-dependent epimerase/dehydratase family protein [Planctomycetales bacterium]